MLSGTLVETPTGDRQIERIRVGDSIYSSAGGRRVIAQVRAVYVVNVAEVLSLRGEGFELCVTEEHPVATGLGEFRAAGRLRVGDEVVRSVGGRFVPGKIQHIERQLGGEAFDFSVMPGGTFIGGGLLVHNKGCFLPGTLVMGADGRSVRIEEVREGMPLRAFCSDKSMVVATVREVFCFEVAGYWSLRTLDSELRVTGEHPLYIGNGVFRTVDRLRVGDVVYEGTQGVLRPTRVTGKEWVPGQTKVHNLRTDAPHTYFAHGFAVHNKGGGGGSRGFSARRSSGFVSGGGGSGGRGLTEEESSMVVGMIVTAYVGVAFFVWRSVRNRGRLLQNGLIPESRWKPKAERVRLLLAEISRSDAGMEISALLDVGREIFLKLQRCWTAQDYSEMAPVMSEPLFTQHTETLRGQEARGERNVIEQIVIRNAEIVFLRYANDTAQREFAMLFEVSMIDYYARRDSGALLRGSRTPSIFQEVWWFRQSRDGWSLDKIEQTGETRVLEMTDVDETGSERGVG